MSYHTRGMHFLALNIRDARKLNILNLDGHLGQKANSVDFQ